MKIQKAREIVIEFERVQLVRKRAKTRVVQCERCGANADFLSLTDAGKLFNLKPELLFQFIRNAGSHYQTQNGNEVLICLNSLLVIMNARPNGADIKMIGGE